jgi:nitroreductase/NAD-dependent dihydropyrimidine dehydrogenase PreA subunit
MKPKSFPPEVILETCTGCGLCVEVCPSFVLDMMNGKATVVRGEWCIGCGHCGAICPVEAVMHQTTAAESTLQRDQVQTILPETLLLLLRQRRSVRLYRDEPVPDSILERILDAGRYAPTGSNSQNVHYVVLRSRDEITRLQEMTITFYERIFSRVRNPFGAFLLSLFAGRRIVEYLRESLPKLEHAEKLIAQGEDCLFYHAAAVMVVHAEAWDTCSAFNCAVALYNCSLMAHILGVGCCFNGYLVSAVNNDRNIKKWLGIPRDHHCFAAMTLGYQLIQYQRLIGRDDAKVQWR